MAVALSGWFDDDGETADSVLALSSECAALHSGHNAMSWDPVMADEMVENGCGWPYEPFLVSAEGGQEDAALDGAPFGARLYAEMWELLARSSVGVCSVGALPDPSDQGFVFGFRYQIAQPGCPGAEPTLDLVVREYASRAQRDAAFEELSEEAPFVLGRWVLTLGDGGGAMADRVTAGLVDLGAIA